MSPILFDLPGIGPVRGYGLMILVGALLAAPGVAWDLRRRGVRELVVVLDVLLAVVIGAYVGGRLLFALTQPQRFLADPLWLLRPESSGFVFFGSLIAAFAGTAWVARKYGVGLGVIWDVLLTWGPLTHAFGRIGCWLAGCCWGAPFTVEGRTFADAAPWPAVRFPPGAMVHVEGSTPHAIDGATIAIHPTQLYEAAGLFVLFAGLLAVRLARGPERPWRQASRYALGYGLLRLLTELFRGDLVRRHVLSWSAPAIAQALRVPLEQPLLLSTSQLVSLALVLVGAVGLARTLAPQAVVPADHAAPPR